MKINIKDGKFTIEGELHEPIRSKSGKSYIVASTSGFIKAINDKGKEFSVSINIITKDNN